MANDPSQQNDPATTDPTGTNAQAAPPAGGDGTGEGADYKALYEKALVESRKWEGRSKANLKQLEELRKQPAAERTVEESLASTYGTICRSASPKQHRRFEASVPREWYSLLRDVRMRVLGG